MYMMDEEIKSEFTEQGADPPVPVGGVGGSAGPPRPLAGDCEVLAVDDQAGELDKTTGERKAKTSKVDDTETDKYGEKCEKQEGDIFEDSDESDRELQTEDKHKHSTPEEVPNQRNRSFSTSDIPAIVFDLTADEEERRVSETRGELRKQVWWKATPKRRLGQNEQPTETEDEAKKLLKVLHKTANDISRLSQVVAENPNTKREIKAISSALLKSASQLINEELTVWIAGKVISPKSKRQKQEGLSQDERIKELENKLEEAESRESERQTQMEELKETIRKMKEEQEKGSDLTEKRRGNRDVERQTDETEKSYKNRQTQTENPEKLTEELAALQIREEVEKAQTPEEIKGIIQREWPEKAYVRTTCRRGNIFKEKDRENLLLIIDLTDGNQKNETIEQATDIWPEIERVIENQRQGKTRVGYIRREAPKFIEDDEIPQEFPDIYPAQYIYTMGIRENDTWDEVIRDMQRVKKSVISNGAKIIQCTPTNEDTKIPLRKILEIVFREIDIRINIITKTGVIGHKTWRKRKRKSTLLIKGNENENTDDIFKKLKKNIDVEEIGIKVNSIEKTRNGNIKIKMEDREEGKGEKVFKEKILQHISSNEENIVWINPKKTFMIRDIDSSIEQEEIKKVLRDRCDIKEEEIEGENAVTVQIANKRNKRGLTYAIATISSHHAEKIQEIAKIKIGWSRCRIQSLETPLKCYKCQEYGHEATECKSEITRKGICFKCGEQGHESRTCENTQKCYVCNEEGHTARSMKCKKYKKAVEELRNRQAERKVRYKRISENSQ